MLPLQVENQTQKYMQAKTIGQSLWSHRRIIKRNYSHLVALPDILLYFFFTKEEKVRVYYIFIYICFFFYKWTEQQAINHRMSPTEEQGQYLNQGIHMSNPYDMWPQISLILYAAMTLFLLYHIL